MAILLYLSDMIIPLLFFSVIATGVLKKQNVYDDFAEGAKDGMKTVANILPTLIGLMVGVGVLRSSGFLDFLAEMQKNEDPVSKKDIKNQSFDGYKSKWSTNW
jgi:spore maturation protein B